MTGRREMPYHQSEKYYVCKNRFIFGYMKLFTVTHYY